jgi:site-specific recombinase XerD
MSDNLGRNKVQPIRSKQDIKDALLYLKREIANVDPIKHPKQYEIKTRNYFLVFLGINIGLRISDLLTITAGQIKRGYIQLREKKTRKLQQIYANEAVLKKIRTEFIEKFQMDDDTYLFKSRNGYNKAITRQNSDLIVKDIADALGWNFPVGTHSLRKTFGRQFYEETNDAVTLQKMFNHRDQRTTMIYIGIIQEEVNEARQGFSLGIDDD